MSGRPTGRRTNNSGSGNVYRRGGGLNLGGSVGNGGGYSGRPGTGSASSDSPNQRSYGGSGGRTSGGRSFFGGSGRGKKLGCLGTLLVILVVVFILVKCGAGLFGGGEAPESTVAFETNASTNPQGSNSGGSFATNPQGSNYGGSFGTYSAGSLDNESGMLDTSVAAGARNKYTKLKGNGQDTVTVMVYMCGADLESQNGAASSDLQEMLYAEDTDKINVLVYTGGCKRWKNNVVSSSVNQIYKVGESGLTCLNKDAGRGAMTDPETLTSFVKWAASAYPANRYELIFWDHGAGSVSGYGYDEKNPSAGSMSLAQINTAIKNTGIKFDFIGFDACLMATLETGLMLAPYADYLIASEETEPASGWYYTDWLTELAQNTSVPTTELGKLIADTYYKANSRYSRSTGLTLSLTDLAELASTVPDSFTEFAKSISGLIENDEYVKVSNARSCTKEFAASSKIDQVDLVNLADNLSNDESKALISTIMSAVKYNITSSNMANAYGLSVYFPYRSLRDVDSMSRTYDELGISSEYSKCISDFASQQTAGQLGGGGSWDVYGSLFGGSSSTDYGYGYSGSGLSGSYGVSNYSGSMTTEILLDLLSLAMNNRCPIMPGDNTAGYLKNANLKKNAEFVTKNSLDPTSIQWIKNERGEKVLGIKDEDWKYVDNVYLNVLYDDGYGFIDMGLDNVYNWNEDGQLLGSYDGSWLAVDGQPVAYYHVSTEGDDDHYSIKGYIPAFVNDERANLLVEFSNENEYGTIYGVQRVYAEGETSAEAKLYELKDGDRIDFICDYYTYDGELENNYYLGETMTVNGEPELSNVTIGGNANAAYKIIDIYNQGYWTPVM